jgi:hypothetical protein
MTKNFNEISTFEIGDLVSVIDVNGKNYFIGIYFELLKFKNFYHWKILTNIGMLEFNTSSFSLIPLLENK